MKYFSFLQENMSSLIHEGHPVLIFPRVNSEGVVEMQGQDKAIDMEVTSSHLLEVVLLILRLQTHFART
jgi:hypothetical protein